MGVLNVLPSEEPVRDPAGQLVAVGVLDVLPSLSSSVYFFWDPEIAPLSPGRSCILAGASLKLQSVFACLHGLRQNDLACQVAAWPRHLSYLAAVHCMPFTSCVHCPLTPAALLAAQQLQNVACRHHLLAVCLQACGAHCRRLSGRSRQLGSALRSVTM